MITGPSDERIVRCFSTILLALLISPSAILAAQKISILAYHRFDPVSGGPTTIRTSVFESQLTWLDSHHYKVISLGAALDALREPGTMIEPAVVITVDDGHRSVYSEMFPLIAKWHIPVTLFVYPSAISNAPYALTWEQLRIMTRSGLVDVQSHSYWHPNFDKERVRLSAVQYEAFVKVQLERPKLVLGSHLGITVNVLAWPFGIHDEYLENAARRAGYQAALAYGGGPAFSGCNEYALPRIPVSDQQTGERFARLLAGPSTTTRSK